MMGLGRGWRSWSMGLAVMLLALAPRAAQGQPAPVLPEADPEAAYRALVELVERAPSRQVGQPGNDAVDALVRERFESAVREQNARQAQRWAEAQRLIAEADAADAQLTETLADIQHAVSPQVRRVSSPLWQRMTLESPGGLVVALLVFGLLLAVVWRFQKRGALLVAAVVTVVLAGLLPVLAMMVETEAERTRREADQEARTDDQLTQARDEAARAALAADQAAARALRGLWQHGRITYPAAAFIPGPATLTVAGGAGGDADTAAPTMRLYALAPNLVEPGNLPEEGFEGPLLYVGSGTRAELAGRDLRGAAVLMDFESGRNWLSAVELGADVVVLLEPAGQLEAGLTESMQKLSLSPLSIPRFYAKRADLTAALGPDWADRLETGLDVRLTQEPGRWERREVAADWLYIPAAGEAEAASAGNRADLVHIQAYKDSASIVPELAPGAQSGANLVLLLRLLEHFEAHPPRRPVLMSVVNDHTGALRGEQIFSAMAFGSPSILEAELLHLDKQLALQRFTERVYRREPTAPLIERLRSWIEPVGGLMVTVKEPVVDTMTLRRNRILLDWRAARVHLRQAEAAAREGDTAAAARAEALRAEVNALQAQADAYLPLMKLFNRFGEQVAYDDLSAEQRAHLKELFAETAETAAQAAAALGRAREQLAENLTVRRRLMMLNERALAVEPQAASYDDVLKTRYAPVPATAVLCLDLTFGSDRVGFFARGQWSREGPFDRRALDRVRPLSRHTLAVAETHAHETGQPQRLVDTLLNTGGIPWTAHLGGYFALGSRSVHQYDQPGLTLTGVQDARALAFSPLDTPDRIERDHFDAVMGFAEPYLVRLVNSEGLEHTPNPVGNSHTLTVELSVHLLDDFSLDITKAKAPGAVVVSVPNAHSASPGPVMFGEVRPWHVDVADARGAVRLRGHVWYRSSFQAFGFDPTFRQVTAALDLGDGERRFSSTVQFPQTNFATRNLVMFQARKVDLLGLTVPLTLSPATQVEVLDARRNAQPLHFSVSGTLATGVAKPILSSNDGTASVFVEPASAFKLRVQDAPVINATPENPLGDGFDAEVGRLRNLALQPAQDMHRLNESRLDLLESKGVSDDTARLLNDAAGQQLAQVEAAMAADRVDKVQLHAEQARGMSYRAYVMTRQTINDLIKAVVIVLGLIIPVCFFLMKLITPFTDVNRQLAAFAGIFVVLALVLQFVHPAFEIATTPQVVVLAFVILGLALFVAGVLFSRFNASMGQAIEEAQMSESVDAPRGRLAGVAFMVGVNNMKRRRIRTTLTAVTVVLVTFTSLSVMSVGRNVEPAQLRLGAEADYNGFVYTRPGMAPIHPVQMQRLRAHFGSADSTVSRVWVQQRGSFGEYLPYTLQMDRPVPGAGAASIGARVMLGLETAEDGFVAPMPVVAGRWFSADDAAEVVLSVAAAELLGITPDNFDEQTHHLWVLGRRLELVGLVDDERLSAIEDLGETPLLPVLSPAGQDVQQETEALAQGEATGTAALDPAGSPLEAPGTQVARPIDLALLPAELAITLPGAEYRALGVKYPADGAGQAWASANDLIRFQHLRLLVGLTDDVAVEEQDITLEQGQYALAASSATQVGGLFKVAIPIALGATIILNTMLGSVIERRREISIYNAIGLNPTHVMIFFLAESLVFGLVGSVAGYLVGQILSVLITRFDLIDLNLNYSSLSVMLVIFITVATVLLSTVYPAVMAARAAVPSGQRKWSLPQPEGDEIQLSFPFIYNDHHVKGVTAYLYEFMQLNTEASTGQFLATPGPVGVVPAHSDGRKEAFAMLFDVAPAPFDLGVNQQMEVYAFYNQRVGAYMLGVHLTRVSGDRSSWVTVNQPFLEALRKRLLGWRSQRPETQQEYCDRGEALFANAPRLPTTPDGSREH